MSQSGVTHLLDSLYDLELLPAKQLEEAVGPLRQQFPQARDLAAECVRRGWLTNFQAERLLAGQGTSLTFGPYLLLERLGQGGMGEVFKARHQLLNRIVALKVTRKELLTDPASDRRFVREIKATARLDHPNIVAVHDAARVGDNHYFAMEFIEGADLGRIVKQQGPLPVARACGYIRQAADGLQHAFEQGMVHRDIKPSNLLVTADGSLVKILDMGVARLCDAEGSDLTATGSVVGTPDYLAPEQATNSRSVDIRADIYSLGCTLYHLLTGHPPFPEGGGLEKALKHLHDMPPPIRNERPDIPPELAVVLDKMMAKKPDERFQEPSEVARALVPFCQDGTTRSAPTRVVAIPAKPPPVDEPAPRTPWFRRRKLVAAAALLFLTGVGVACWESWFRDGRGDRKPAFTNSIGMEFVLVPAGEFAMGSPSDEPGRRDDEGPVHTVTISRPFYLASRETTVRQFRSFAETNRFTPEPTEMGEGALEWDPYKKAWQMNRKARWYSPGGSQDQDDPVVCVNRADAEAFCQWLSWKEKRTYRLPTEAEWEYACRAGTTTAYATGTTLTSDQARFALHSSSQSDRDTHRRLGSEKVGSFAPNRLGLFDMHGNVWEWCADLYSPTAYKDGPTRDPTGARDSDKSVLRGGSWQSGVAECRSAARLPLSPSTRRNDVGFRVLLEAGVR
jgi:formylglycine-generating enzyme required for sulfatase activity/tRNA A-37 threonylcarbamoyl transferase component Bud32